MLLLGPKVLLCLTAFIIPSDWTPLGANGQRGDDVTPVTPEAFTEDPNLVNEPSTDETVLADIEPSTDDLAPANDKNTTADCRDEKFACTRLYSVHRPVKQCIHQLCFTRLEFSLPMVFAISFLNHVTGTPAAYDVCTSSTMRSALVLSVKNMK
ncbi:microfibrillar-associated protein 5 isoform X4 [Herpailurus yagouaroundi]|uniref:microfibrillar-associated protein 5 isoform X4 n=1 Tax=Herpailurus yagouaroundi TaxID=1608482 RepID=UPI001AD682EA|nr:microfibrillar-associated protein 5 isoform X4 [Puma yagouaroundi]